MYTKFQIGEWPANKWFDLKNYALILELENYPVLYFRVFKGHKKSLSIYMLLIFDLARNKFTKLADVQNYKVTAN